MALRPISTAIVSKLSFIIATLLSNWYNYKWTIGNWHKNGSSYLHYLDSWVFEDFMLADEPFTKVLQSVEICAIVNNDLNQKLLLSL